MGEMAILEEKMQAIAESGQTLVERLKHSGHRQERGSPGLATETDGEGAYIAGD